MPKRLDPDEILKQIVKLSSGRHKIYLGVAPGTGKTFRMLEEALDLKNKGVDIVIGYIEMQNRPENHNLINSFPAIPRKKFTINDKDFYDMDLDAIIERRPATIIVDELAHNNISGSRNQKRYQDIQDLLKEGISVLSTLNIHQLDGIAPIVEKSFGIKINETVPDWVLNQAEEVVLIDISIDELYNRLHSKQIYTGEQLKHALNNFFKRSNLNLLRDLALNFLAERVDIEVVTEKLKAKIKDRILVAASPEESSINLINHASEIAKAIHGDLDIVCFLKDNVNQDLLNKIRETCKLKNGNLFLIKDIRKSVADELIHLINLNRITQVITGYEKKQKFGNIFHKSIALEVLNKTNDLDLLILKTNNNDESLSESTQNKSTQATYPTGKQGNFKFGKLKIYIGMAPGVGKTYKMLQDGRELQKQGINVLLGVIDTHGRTETAKLMDGLPVLQPKLIEHKGKYLPEFDLEGAILTKPEYILVDELAHTNAPRSINNKRYQDVQYLLRAGINVLSTVNIQHIESLNDTVEQVTGIKVRETVPDWVISHASEIVLIDLSPEALQERLKAGKIYTIDKIEQALTHFFQRKNLIALRELSLREVAESVEHELYPKEKKVKILSFVDINPDTLKLVRKSARIANRLQGELIVMHILKNTKAYSEEKKLAIIELEQLIVEIGGDFRLVEGRNIIEEMKKAEEKVKPHYIIVGEPKHNTTFPFLQGAVTKHILKNISDSHIWIVSEFQSELEE